MSKRISISLKVAVAVLLTVVVVMVIGSYFILKNQSRFFTDQMKQEADILADGLGLSLNKIVSDNLNNHQYMQNMTEKLGKTIGVDQIEVYDLNRIVIADTDRNELGKIATGEEAEDVIKVIKTGKSVSGNEIKEGKKVYSKTVPIFIEKEDKKEIVGVAEINMSLAEITRLLTVKEQADILAVIVGLNLQKVMGDNFTNQEYIQKLTEELGRQKGVDQIEIYDTAKKVIADTDRNELGKIATYEDLEEVLKTGKQVSGFEIMEGKEVYSKTIPVYTKLKDKSELAGALEISMSVPYIKSLIASSRNKIILLTIFIVLAISIVTILLLRKGVIIPILSLSKVTKEIAEGDLNKRAQISSKDEIGDLAVSFNYMTDEIQKRNEELQTMNEELRSTNEELTSSNEELQITTEELEASNEELKETQEQLIQKEKLAAVGQLASGVGHELRNPLGVIKNAVYYIKSKIGESDPKLTKHIGIVEKEIDNSNKIISDLLGFSRTRKPELIPIEINEVVEEAISVANIPENVKVIKNLGSGLPKPAIDRDQIRQVFLNVIINAYQAMPGEGGIKISSRLQKSGLKEKDCVEIEFTDTGTGISPENINKIFDPFYTSKARGIGLGLAVTKQIIEKHSGDIEVKSEVRTSNGVGGGTTFIIKLGI